MFNIIALGQKYDKLKFKASNKLYSLEAPTVSTTGIILYNKAQEHYSKLPSVAIIYLYKILLKY